MISHAKLEIKTSPVSHDRVDDFMDCIEELAKGLYDARQEIASLDEHPRSTKWVRECSFISRRVED